MGRRGHNYQDSADGNRKGSVRLSEAKNPELMAGQWLKNAENDLTVASTLFAAGHYNWAAFACQQSIEKLLKAGYVRSRKKIPPHVHKLQRLTAIMKIDPPDKLIDILIEIDECYTTTRYPGYKNSGCLRTRQESQAIIEKTWKAYRWLKKELQL